MVCILGNIIRDWFDLNSYGYVSLDKCLLSEGALVRMRLHSKIYSDFSTVKDIFQTKRLHQLKFPLQQILKYCVLSETLFPSLKSLLLPTTTRSTSLPGFYLIDIKSVIIDPKLRGFLRVLTITPDQLCYFFGTPRRSKRYNFQFVIRNTSSTG